MSSKNTFIGLVRANNLSLDCLLTEGRQRKNQDALLDTEDWMFYHCLRLLFILQVESAEFCSKMSHS